MSSDAFFRDLPPFEGFERIADPTAYTPVPDDWVVGIADIASSTKAIEAGRYKAVNLAGASAISAISNRLGTLDFAYVFAGDGMTYAVGPSEAAEAEAALAATIPWVGQQLDLTLRGGIVAVSAIRAAGRDLRVARFSPSPAVTYAMFAGGGLAWAEEELKAGRLRYPQGAPDAVPDLSGLSCRFKPLAARNGLILSLIVAPVVGGDEAAFEALVRDLLALVEASGERAKPVSAQELPLAWPPKGFMMETRLQRRAGQPLLLSGLKVAARTAFHAAVMAFGRNVGRFSPQAYRQQVADNSDFRKYEDGLMMTIDCSAVLVGQLRARLDAAHRDGVADYGMHEQDTALITCVMPSPTQSDHVHFVDGAAGGYAVAARHLKRTRSAPHGAQGPPRAGIISQAGTGTSLGAMTA